MGWTHDYRDSARFRRSFADTGRAAPTAVLTPEESRLGIPRILGRRARWVSARLRHVRD
ncbi:hypothetical protein [Actinacidiphila guanduensis]|jgi:hypothetical protein|uniref:Uncharacterized protein n=1 Tax=Actinacidiphila guanduensis TaxID=310781 RepID=A0A1H0P2I3_9ACTN|nr:hypothetical protein [Actinacidiphila guanduensis]SDO99173.1 hypothetical protein SAMN05216259_11532 [Actinacidiphila guanduensis]